MLIFLTITVFTDQCSFGYFHEEQDFVILLHGMGRTWRSMTKMEKSLVEDGYRVINLRYPSRKHSIPVLAEEYLHNELPQVVPNSPTKIHFVTHSLGGIIVRYYLKHNKLPNLGNTVMLSPPNQGSEVVDFLKDFFIFKSLFGRAGQQLGTDIDSLPNSLGAVDYYLGIITGNRTINPINSIIIPGVDDGKVSVERAQVKGMTDLLVVRCNHAMIMKNREVIRQTKLFLKTKQFSNESIASD